MFRIFCLRTLTYFLQFQEEYDLIGEYIASFLSSINHSCDPNVMLITTTDKHSLLYALYPIEKDSQVHIYILFVSPM